MKKAIIFGANGQDGYYLSLLLNSKGLYVVKVSRSGGDVIGDVTDYTFVRNLIKNLAPDYIFNLAANSSTKHSVIFENHATISSGTLNILESVKEYSQNSKIFICGSAIQFENMGDAIDEKSPFKAISAYSASRIYSVYLARYYREHFGLQIYIGYLFNHDSPVRKASHFNQKVILGIKEILVGSENKIDLGNLTIRKEFGFAGDFVEAIWLFVNQNNLNEVVIGTGKTYSLKQWVKICFEIVGLDWEKYVKHNENQKIEYNILWSNPKLIQSIGWIPKVEIENLAKMMIKNIDNI